MGLKRFDYKLKDNSKKKSIIVTSIIVLVLLVGITIYATYAEYKDTKTYNIIQGKVGEFINGDIKISVVAIDPEGKETSIKEFPSYLEYNFLAEQSSCINGSTIEFDEIKWSATISSSGKDTCTLKFEQRSDKTLANAIKANTVLIEDEPDFSVVATDANTNIYQAIDDLGDSYYFRGAPTNNYVQFGEYATETTLNLFDYNSWGSKTVTVPAGTPMYWRIVRINGDGSIRLIYDGIELVANGVAHTATIQATAYNTNRNDAKYVGYTYDNSGTQTDSTIKGVIDAWYDKHLKTTYGSYIADGIFCNDRSGATTGEYGYIYYAPYDRLYTNKTPTLTCKNKADRYTTSTEIGNGKLTDAEGNARPIGLLTADEAIMAGGATASNMTYYLYSGEFYWTSAPYLFDDNFAYVWRVGNGGGVNSNYVSHGGSGARPVINLKADTLIEGKGTIDSPYKLASQN